MLAYVIDISHSLKSFHRENVFKLIFLFIEDLVRSEIAERQKNIFLSSEELERKGLLGEIQCLRDDLGKEKVKVDYLTEKNENLEWLLMQLYRTISGNSFIETKVKLLSDFNFCLSLLPGSKHCPPTKKDIKIDTEGYEGSNVLEGQWKMEDTDTNLRWYDGVSISVGPNIKH